MAQSVLDYAEAEKMITKAERQGKLTTAARFLNPMFQEIIGLDRSKTDELGRTRPKAEFDTMLSKFMRDLVEENEVTSRKNRLEIIQYARTLGAMIGVSNNRIESEPLADDGNGRTSPTKRPSSTPRKPEKARHVRHDDEIFKALKSYRNDKLSSLYYSICALELERNTPIACIGAWAFFETLTACQGRHERTNFEAYLSKAKLVTFGLVGDTQAVRLAVGRILAYGNFTKHHPTSATFNGDQLNNDLITLKEIILKCIEEASARPSLKSLAEAATA